MGGLRSTFAENSFNILVRPRNDVHRDDFADLSGRCRTRIRCGLYRADIAPHHHGYEATADLFSADQPHICGLHHGVGRFNGTNQPLRLD